MNKLRKFTATATLAAALLLTPALTTSAQAGIIVSADRSETVVVSSNADGGGVVGYPPGIITGGRPQTEASDNSSFESFWKMIYGILLG